jgi:hypothetical protein
VKQIVECVGDSDQLFDTFANLCIRNTDVRKNLSWCGVLSHVVFQMVDSSSKVCTGKQVLSYCFV